MKRIGFCVLNEKYKDRLKTVLNQIGNHDIKIYTDKNFLSNFNTLEIPKVEINFKSGTCYDKFMNLLLAKIKIFSDLSLQYEQVFNFDLDMDFRRDITKVLDKYSEPYLYGCLEDTNRLRLYERRKQVLKFIGIDEFHYINAGFMIMNFQYHFDIEEVKWFFEHCPFSNCPEQDFFNWKFKDKIKVMSNDVCWNKFLPFHENPYIIHYLGFPKPF